MEADLDRDGKISFEEFTKMVENTDVSINMTLGTCEILRLVELADLSRYILSIWLRIGFGFAGVRRSGTSIIFSCY